MKTSRKPKTPNRRSVQRDCSVDTFEMAASYADGRHYVETTDAVLDAMISAKEHLDKEGCDYVRIMRQREYPPDARYRAMFLEPDIKRANRPQFSETRAVCLVRKTYKRDLPNATR